MYRASQDCGSATDSEITMLAAVVTADPALLALCHESLTVSGYMVRATTTLAEALDAQLVEPVEILVIDAGLELPDADWLRLRQTSPPLVIFGRGTDLQRRLRALNEAEHAGEQKLLSQRMDALSTLANGAAHEINNPLAYNVANIQLVSEILATRGSPADADLVQALDEAYDGALRVRDLLRDLRIFAQAASGERGAVELKPLLHRAMRLAEAELRGRAWLVTQHASVPPVYGSEALLGQLFVHLLTNAARAIVSGNPEDHVVSVTTLRLPDGRVAVDVTDSGVGMEPETVARMFDPFFTTRPIGKGIGLGLSLCYAIASSIKGAIEVRTAPGNGTTVRVLLQVADVPVRRRRILVIDDEPTVAAALHSALGEELDLVTVTNAQDALLRIDTGEHYDLIFCELELPAIDAMKLHEELRERGADLADRLLFLSPNPARGSDGALQFLASMQERWVVTPIDPEGLKKILGKRWE